MKYLYHNRRVIALFLTFLLLFQVAGLPTALALTAGPSQPEVQSFEPATTTEMVNLFTGDFVYNIPLFELQGPNGGYPFNLAYHASINMDMESSWCGLGWNLSPGAITRQMRGLPDEFDGDSVYTKMSISPSVTVGLSAGVNKELLGKDLNEASARDFGVTVYQNNYRGLGYDINNDFGYSKVVGSMMTAGIGLAANLNGEDAGMSPSLSLDGKLSRKSGIPYQNNPISTYASEQNLKEKNSKEQKLPFINFSTLSCAYSGNLPQIGSSFTNVGISSTFKAGDGSWGSFANYYESGFYNEQSLKNDKKRVAFPAYGYLNYQHGVATNALLDFNREKDGVVSKVSSNLPAPNLTYDIYAVSGQGISAMYRPLRKDFGIVHDMQSTSSSFTNGIGSDVVPSGGHVGINEQVSGSTSTSGTWTDNNVQERVGFQDKTLNNSFEPYYFKMHGEPSAHDKQSLRSLGGTDPVRLKLTGDGDSSKIEPILEKKNWSSSELKKRSDHQRESRANVVQQFTNQQLLNSDKKEVLSQFNINYVDASGVEQRYNRSVLPKHHIAAFTTLTTAGLRYNYGVPVYNKHQEEVTFSVPQNKDKTSRVNVGTAGQDGDPVYNYDNTDNFFQRTELPPYAHAYLLTSIVGPDYVDVTDNGLSEDDLGYWVKFTYKKATTDTDYYKWRHPYSQAYFLEGKKTNPKDDKGSFLYGEKELWYLAKAETKTHIAVFSTVDREDGFGAVAKLQDTNQRGRAMQALKEIKMYTRAAGSTSPMQTIKFEYDYSLCPGVNNSITNKGKLTLKKVWFEYGSNSRGKLNPYIFSYDQNNPTYDLLAYDRWGTYKPYPKGQYLFNQDFPYAEQNPLKKTEIDANASAWTLNEIQLPSGGKVLIDYESDDYAYVQHKVAMQMTALVDPNNSMSSLNSTYTVKDNDTKIRFDLERPISGEVPKDVQKNEVLKYIDTNTKQLYFKILVNLKNVGENRYEYVSGYADIDFSREMGLEKDASGQYMYGYFYIFPEKGHHPFSVRAWQHLRTNQPELAASGIQLRQTSDKNERIDQIKSLGTVSTSIRKMFDNFYTFCDSKNLGREIVLGKSWVRLKSADKIKFGGGLRVRQITMNDQWEQDEEGIYGQVYDYTTNEDGETISSGVASYEPLIGGDENPIRYAKKYIQPGMVHSDNNLFFEYPLNESYYPGPQVGYRKVSVYSLASASLAGKIVKHTTLSDGRSLFPSGEGVSYGTSGMTVHEFYTAKDFPVITQETEKINKSFDLQAPIPFLGNVSISKLTTSQGYSVITNDMHGKFKMLSTYRQDKNGRFDTDPISWIRYNYHADTIFYQEQKVLTLSNTFKDNGNGTLSKIDEDNTDVSNPQFTLGQENEFFGDMREFKDESWTTGLNLNNDVLSVPLISGTLPIAIASRWPHVMKTTRQVRTAVTNKVIFKSGIIESIESFDKGSLTKAKHLKWDKLTGAPVLSVVNNSFNAPVYSYSVPAYTKYPGMGGAYQNTGLVFELSRVQKSTLGRNIYQIVTDLESDLLFHGDEVILYETHDGVDVPVTRAVYIGEENGVKNIFSESTLVLNSYRGIVVRSGFRNQLTSVTSTMEALDDPTVDVGKHTYNHKVSVLKKN